jgi:hypothetical protein
MSAVLIVAAVHLALLARRSAALFLLLATAPLLALRAIAGFLRAAAAALVAAFTRHGHRLLTDPHSDGGPEQLTHGKAGISRITAEWAQGAAMWFRPTQRGGEALPVGA